MAAQQQTAVAKVIPLPLVSELPAVSRLICPDCLAAVGRQNPHLTLSVLLAHSVQHSMFSFHFTLISLSDADLGGLLEYAPTVLKDEGPLL